MAMMMAKTFLSFLYEEINLVIFKTDLIISTDGIILTFPEGFGWNPIFMYVLGNIEKKWLTMINT